LKNFRKLPRLIFDGDLFELWGINGVKEPISAAFNSLMIKYHLNFKKDEIELSHHFFTINSRDNFSYIEQPAANSYNYYDEFDTAFEVNGYLEWQNKGLETEVDIDDIFDLKGKESRALTESEEKIVKMLSEVRPEKDSANKILETVKSHTQLHFRTCYQEKEETLTAEYMGDVIPEPCLGFRALEPKKNEEQ